MDKETSEIAKLTERISRDPKSKLFVPLAEEYKKLGDIEMSIFVLAEGLKNNPGYVTARSLLGRLLLDKGDLAGAQKELQEVVNTIPDNLLAQRKLGDIYILQGRPQDALVRYKAALALNPADKEIASFVADLESGKDIAARVPKPKMQPAPEQTPKSPAQTQSGAAQKTAGPAAAPAQALKPASRPAGPGSAPAGAPAAPKAPPGPAAPAIPSMSKQAPSPAVSGAMPPQAEEPEAVEEVTEIEAVDEAAQSRQTPERDLKAAGYDFLAEPPQSPVPSAGPQAAEETATPPWEPAATAEAAVPSEPGPGEFDTDTLAELYISQGFYDKAIEIYDRILADQPGNQAIRDKLARLRTMAAGSAAGEEEARRPLPSAASGFEAREYVPPLDSGEGPGESTPPSEAPEAGPKPSMQKPDEPLPQGSAGHPAPAAQPAGPQTPTARRKETIDRLEQWLANIVKEKP